MKIKLPFRLLNIEGDGYHLQVKVRINGKPALMIVDTGASRSVFDRTQIEKYIGAEKIGDHDRLSTGLGTSTMKSQFVVLKSFTIKGIRLQNFGAVILDLQHVNHTYDIIGLPAVAGVLGSDILVRLNAVIDFRRKEITLTRTVKTARGKSSGPKKRKR